MKLPDKAIIEFRDLYRREFGEDIPYDEAKALAQSLMALTLIAIRPLRLGINAAIVPRAIVPN